MAWNLTGNSGTNPASDFLGTTDPRPVVVKTNNQEVVRIHADAPAGKVDIAAQEIMLTGFHPFITLRDTDGARSFLQGVNGDIVLSTESNIGGDPAMVLKNGSGNLGIGTLDPTSKVEIIAQDGLAVTGFQPFITLRDANAENARGCMQCIDGDIALIPNSFLDGSNRVAMVLKTGTGNLGIGTADPFSQLEIAGNAPFITLRDTANLDIIGGGHGRCFIQAIDGNIVLKPSSGARQAVVLMTGTGNVGIGTRQPIDRLHVLGSVRVDGPGGHGSFDGDVTARSFVQVSDRNAKANFSDVNTHQILEKLTGLPIRKWNYKTDPTSMHHIGPTAQDFRIAFELNGDDDAHISSVDVQGIALAAIQGLNEKLNAENEQLRTSLVSLETRLAALESNLEGAGINAV